MKKPATMQAFGLFDGSAEANVCMVRLWVKAVVKLKARTVVVLNTGFNYLAHDIIHAFEYWLGSVMCWRITAY